MINVLQQATFSLQRHAVGS